jgi:hypothetical protein
MQKEAAEESSRAHNGTKTTLEPDYVTPNLPHALAIWIRVNNQLESRTPLATNSPVYLLLICSLTIHRRIPFVFDLRSGFTIPLQPGLDPTQLNPNKVGDDTRVESPIIKSNVLWVLPEDTARLGPTKSEKNVF